MYYGTISKLRSSETDVDTGSIFLHKADLHAFDGDLNMESFH